MSLFKKNLIVLFILLSNISKSSAEIEVKVEKLSKKEPFLVRAIDSESQQKEGIISVYGTTQHLRKINLKPEISGKISEITAKEGSIVKKGDIIAKIAIENRNNELKKMQSLVSKAELEYKVAKSLLKSGHRSETKLAEALANLRSSRSDLNAIKIDIERTNITSPFDGMIQEINLEEGDLIKARETQIATVIDYSYFLAVGFIPEQKIYEIQLGNIANVKPTSSPEPMEGVVEYISQIADSVTRTFKVEVKVPFSGVIIKEGLTTKIEIPTKSYKAHLVSSSYLSLNDDGEIGIKTVNKNNEVKFNIIKIVDESKNGIWVLGLNDRVRIITLGQAFVSEGEIVKISKTN